MDYDNKQAQARQEVQQQPQATALAVAGALGNHHSNNHQDNHNSIHKLSLEACRAEDLGSGSGDESGTNANSSVENGQIKAAEGNTEGTICRRNSSNNNGASAASKWQFARGKPFTFDLADIMSAIPTTP